MGTRFPGVPGPPPSGGTIGVVIPAPPHSQGCECSNVSVHWAIADDDDASSTASTTACPAILSADGTICPDATWAFDLAWDGSEDDIPEIQQIGATTWKVAATVAGTLVVTPKMNCGGVQAFAPMTDAIGSGGGGGGVAEWQNMKDIATVVANPDMHGEGSAYDPGTGVYSMSQGTGDYGDYATFDITVDESNLPVCCRVILLSGNFGETNLATAFFQTNSDPQRGFYLRFSVGSTTFNENFSIHTDDGQVRLALAYVHGGDYTPTTFRIDYIATDS